MQVLVQDGDRMVVMEPVGEIDLTNDDDAADLADGQRRRSSSAVAGDDGTWSLWQWLMVSRTEIAALPWGTVCFDDVDDPTIVRAC